MKSIEELGISLSPWVKYGDIVEDAEGNVIFNAYDDPDYQDAQLIAAAPELYEACVALLSCAEKDICSIDHVVDMARKAIEKAGGMEA